MSVCFDFLTWSVGFRRVITKGDWITLPSPEELHKKRFQVLCEERDAAKGFLQRVSTALVSNAAAIAGSGSDEVRYMKDLAVILAACSVADNSNIPVFRFLQLDMLEFTSSRRTLLCTMCDHICEAANAPAPATLHLHDACELAASTEDAECLETLLAHMKESVGNHSGLRVSIR
jgi:hypothetical protein